MEMHPESEARRCQVRPVRRPLLAVRGSHPVSEGQMKVPGSICRKPLIAAHVFLGLHLCFAFKRHNQRGMMSSVLSYCSGFGLGCLSPSSYLGG